MSSDRKLTLADAGITPRPKHERMSFEELLDMLGDVKVCFWNGLPPCPNCGKNHGDPEATPELDAEYRAERERILAERKGAP